MDKINLENKYKDFIKTTVHSILPEAEIFIFGSRVQNTSSKYSDVDIALKCKSEIDIDTLLKLKTIFKNSTLPYKVDIIDLTAIDEHFKNIIKDDLILL